MTVTAGGVPVVLVAHGSRDPRAAGATRALARAVAAARPGLDVRVAYLDHSPPRPQQVLCAVQDAGYPAATVVPLLLTAAYHGRVDIPAVVEQAVGRARMGGPRVDVRVTGVLGPVGGRVHPALLAGLRRRLDELAALGEARAGLGQGFDALVLAAAGTWDAAARATVGQVARVLGGALGVPCVAAYASASGPTGEDAVRRLRAAGARRVAVSAYFLAPGRLYESMASSVRAAGAVGMSAPLGGAPEIADLVLDRVCESEPVRTVRSRAWPGVELPGGEAPPIRARVEVAEVRLRQRARLAQAYPGSTG